MHTGFTYLLPSGLSASIYAPPGFDAPDTLTLRSPEGSLATFERASDRVLTCDPVVGVNGTCGSYECHRKQPGVCQCKRHPQGVPIRRAQTAPTGART